MFFALISAFSLSISLLRVDSSQRLFVTGDCLFVYLRYNLKITTLALTRCSLRTIFQYFWWQSTHWWPASLHSVWSSDLIPCFHPSSAFWQHKMADGGKLCNRAVMLCGHASLGHVTLSKAYFYQMKNTSNKNGFYRMQKGAWKWFYRTNIFLSNENIFNE